MLNLLAALTLSTKREAFSAVVSGGKTGWNPVDYILKVSEVSAVSLAQSEPPTPSPKNQEEEPQYLLEIFHVTYPNRQEGKGWGTPKVAEKPHFSRQFTQEALVSFFDQRDFTVDEAWQVAEGGIQTVLQGR